jgi:hypothetical protein
MSVCYVAKQYTIVHSIQPSTDPQSKNVTLEGICQLYTAREKQYISLTQHMAKSTQQKRKEIDKHSLSFEFVKWKCMELEKIYVLSRIAFKSVT